MEVPDGAEANDAEADGVHAARLRATTAPGKRVFGTPSS
jgi:hypothetical protein